MVEGWISYGRRDKKKKKRTGAVLGGAFKHLNQVQVTAPWLSPMSDPFKKKKKNWRANQTRGTEAGITSRRELSRTQDERREKKKAKNQLIARTRRAKAERTRRRKHK